MTEITDSISFRALYKKCELYYQCGGFSQPGSWIRLLLNEDFYEVTSDDVYYQEFDSSWFSLSTV